MFGLAMQKASEAGVYRIASGYQVSTGVAMAKSGVGADEPDR